LIHFYHACLFSPTKSQLIKAINRGYFKGVPGLTSPRVSRHITINNATEKGHMDQTRKGQRSTSCSNPSISLINSVDDDNNDDLPTTPIDIEPTNLVYMNIHGIHRLNRPLPNHLQSR
jgi:hypothetical protein